MAMSLYSLEGAPCLSFSTAGHRLSSNDPRGTLFHHFARDLAMSRLRSIEQQTAIDLFAGAGGATAGLFLAGCNVRLAVECDAGASETYSSNFPQVELLPDLVERFTPSFMLERAGLRLGELDILTACPPCQGFSTLGKRDSDDPRNDYVLSVASFVQELRPRALIFENVAGIANDRRLSVLRSLLGSLGYGVNSWVLDARDFCVPQHRRRFVLIAIEGRLDADITDPRSSYKCCEWEQHPHTVRGVLGLLPKPGGIDELHKVRQLPPHVLERVRAIPINGGSRTSLPEELQLACHKRLLLRGAASIYGRMAWDRPSPTMTTRCTTPACGRFLHPEEDRPITLREAAAFQTFAPDYQWRGGVMSIMRQIGNAVPVRMANVLALHVISLLPSAASPA
jgi:DNA (cytosine-5)-methyltransferase 1